MERQLRIGINRKIRAVGRAYQKLIADWRDVLPTQSVCLQVPIVFPVSRDVESVGPKAEPADACS